MTESTHTEDGSIAFVFEDNLCAIDITQNPGEILATLKFFFSDDVDDEPREATPEEIAFILDQPETEEALWSLLLITSEQCETWGYLVPQITNGALASGIPWAIA